MLLACALKRSLPPGLNAKGHIWPCLPNVTLVGNFKCVSIKSHLIFFPKNWKTNTKNGQSAISCYIIIEPNILFHLIPHFLSYSSFKQIIHTSIHFLWIKTNQILFWEKIYVSIFFQKILFIKIILLCRMHLQNASLCMLFGR